MVFSKWRVKLIDNIGDAAKFGSIWASAGGFVISLLEAMLQSYHLLPPSVQALIPESSPIFAGMFLLVIVARLFKVEKVDAEDNS